MSDDTGRAPRRPRRARSASRPVPSRSSVPSRAAPRDPGPESAAHIVADLWRQDGPDAHAGQRPIGAVVHTVAATLAAVAADAERLDAHGAADERAAARLLAGTARALRDALDRSAAEAAAREAPFEAPGEPSWPVRLRLGRMERWLAGRAATDPGAAPAADLCFWVLEHLDAAAR